jgi:haloacetate dehalogenase
VLAERFSVYVPDLRGYGDSSRPTDGDRHLNHSFRAIALDQIETMRHFGHTSTSSWWFFLIQASPLA